MSGEPVTTYLAKGGEAENTPGKRCLCNALLANIGHPQTRSGKHVEQGLIAAGDDLTSISEFLTPGQGSYRAVDVLQALLGNCRLRAPQRSKFHLQSGQRTRGKPHRPHAAADLLFFNRIGSSIGVFRQHRPERLATRDKSQTACCSRYDLVTPVVVRVRQALA